MAPALRPVLPAADAVPPAKNRLRSAYEHGGREAPRPVGPWAYDEVNDGHVT